jgi:hypothetical protein
MRTKKSQNTSSIRPSLPEEHFHRLLVTAIFQFGISIASPAKIAQELRLRLRFPGLRSEHIKSHLQRFRKSPDAALASFLGKSQMYDLWRHRHFNSSLLPFSVRVRRI